MSYEKVKSIKIKDGKVFINCASNNCRPLDYKTEEYPYFTQILQEKGLEELDLSLLEIYEGGSFQDGNNKYTRALKVLYYVYGEEYKPFSWRNNGEEYERANELRKTQAFKDLLLKALKTKLPKEKFIIKKSENVFVKKITSRFIFYGNESQAKEFDFKQEAEPTAKHINGEVILK